MFTTSKRFNFSAAHALDHLESGRQCAKPHGHNYTVEVIMQARVLSSESFVRDPIDYPEFEDDLAKHFQAHRTPVIGSRITPDVFAVVDGDQIRALVDEALRTTTENIARAIYLRLKSDFSELVAVKVFDTPDTWAVYQPDDHPLSGL
jgi:6-pyruvoyltetrahydropterin/6-carboxytetrahydropterin synthase